jgi:hypothetical protein
MPVRGNPDIPLNVGQYERVFAQQVARWTSPGRERRGNGIGGAMFWKIVGGLIVAWVAFMVLGAVIGFLFKAVLWIAIIAGAVFLGTAAYGAISGKKNPKQVGR